MTMIGRLRTVPGTLPEDVGVTLADLAVQVPAELAIVDIGADRARSTCYLAFGARLGAHAPVYGIDGTWTTRGRQLAWLSVRQQGLRDQVTLLDGSSEEAAATWDGPKVALLYVNGDEFDAKTAAVAWRRHLVDRALVAYADGHAVHLREVEAAPPKALEPQPPEPKPEPIQPATVDISPGIVTTGGGFSPTPVQPQPTPEPDGLESLTVPKLLQLGRSEGAQVNKNMRKRDIIDTIRKHRG